jgi:hypothetical protein
MVWARAIAVWLLLMLAESINGTVRALCITPRLGDFAARRLGVFTGSLIILVIGWVFVRWIGARTRRSRLGVGLLWLCLTVAFEVGIGRLVGRSWSDIAVDYDVSHGGLLPFALVVLALAPWIAAHVRAWMDR